MAALRSAGHTMAEPRMLDPRERDADPVEAEAPDAAAGGALDENRNCYSRTHPA